MPRSSEAAGAFFGPGGDAILVDCAVLFVDVLGVRAMSNAPDAAQHLLRFQRTVRRRFRDYLAPDSAWPARFFSDTLVLASPIYGGDEESAIGGLVLQAANLQLSLIDEGFFLRGSLVLGALHMGELLFGPALVEAYELESQRAVHPRVVLSERAASSARDALSFYADPGESPQNATLMRDDDGFAFVDYLGLVLDQSDDPAAGLHAHRDAVRRRLAQHRDRRRQWEKYRWVAEYHNAVCATALPGRDELLIPAGDATWRFRSFA